MWLPIIIFMIRLLKSCQKKFKMCTNAFVCTCIDITQKLLYLNPKWKCCCYDVLIKINSVYEHFEIPTSSYFIIDLFVVHSWYWGPKIKY